MTRLPREGRNKTRLIPALGPAGATSFHDRLARHAIGRASSYVLGHPGSRLEIHLEGGAPSQGRSWLGEVDCISQENGDLGERMNAAVERAFSEGARRVVVIGTDCPSIDEALLGEAFASLENREIVFGPAVDGGYYLVGLSRPCREIFTGITWGGPDVLRQSLAAAKNIGINPTLLETMSDVDFPEDLPSANTALTVGSSLSVIIPTLNEEEYLPRLLEQLQRESPHQIIIADGGSSDRTVEIAQQFGALIVHGKKGRAAQMNLGAAAATGEFLLFLHADTAPPPDFSSVIHRILLAPGVSAGAFSFSLEGELPAGEIISIMVNLRCRLFQTPYGDQGIFLRRSIFVLAECFPEWPVMEDLHIIRRLKRIGRIYIAKEAARTSQRRWEKRGTTRTFLRHQLMIAAYYIGVPAAHIAKLRL